jgi:hypothetical protein
MFRLLSDCYLLIKMNEKSFFFEISLVSYIILIDKLSYLKVNYPSRLVENIYIDPLQYSSLIFNVINTTG